MSWLGVNLNESLRNIGGQISSLTKEVLSEDLDDGDGGSEVVITQRRFCELQTTAVMRLQEVQALKAELQDVQQRLHAADLQAAHRSEARNAELSQLQEEVRILREQQATWQWGAGGASSGDLVEGADDHHTDQQLQSQQVQQLHREEVANLLQQLEQLKAGVPGSPSQVCRCSPTHTCGNTGTPAGGRASEDGQQEVEALLLQVQQLQQNSNKQKEACSGCAQLQQENSGLQESLQQLDSEHQAHTETLLAKRNEFQQTVDEQSQQLLELRQLLDSQQHEQERRQQELVGTYQHQIQSLLEEKNLLQAKIRDLDSNLLDVKQHLEKVTSDQSEAVKEKDNDLEVKIQELQKNVYKLGEELSRVASERAKTESEKVQLEAAVSELQEKQSHERLAWEHKYREMEELQEKQSHERLAWEHKYREMEELQEKQSHERLAWEHKYREMEEKLTYVDREAASVQDQQHNAIKSREEALTAKTHEVMQLKVNVAELERIKAQLEDRIATQDLDAEQQALAALKAQRNLEAQVRDFEQHHERFRALNQEKCEEDVVREEGVVRDDSRVVVGMGATSDLVDPSVGVNSSSDLVDSSSVAVNKTAGKAPFSPTESVDELEVTQRLVEVEAALEREKIKFGKLQEALWERENELQQLRESQQRWMLEGEVPQVSSAGATDPSQAAGRVVQLEAYISQLRLQLRDTTHLLQASHIQQAELAREVDELRDQLEAEEGGPCLGRTPPDGGCVLSPSPSRLLHTIDEEEVAEGYPSNLDEDREQVDGGEDEECPGGGFTALKSLDTITEEDDGDDAFRHSSGKSATGADSNRQQALFRGQGLTSVGSGVEPEAVVERLQKLSLISDDSTDRSQLLKKIQALTTETNQLRELVSRLENEALMTRDKVDSQLDEAVKDGIQNDDTALVVAPAGRTFPVDDDKSGGVVALRDIQEAKQTLEEQIYTLVLERDAVKTQLIYKQDQYDNLMDGVRRVSGILGQEDDDRKTGQVDVDELCESVAAVVERLKNRDREHSTSPPPDSKETSSGEGANSKEASPSPPPGRGGKGGSKNNKKSNKVIEILRKEKATLEKKLSSVTSEKDKVLSRMKESEEFKHEKARLEEQLRTLEQNQKVVELHLNNVLKEDDSYLSQEPELPLSSKVQALVRLCGEQREEVLRKTRQLAVLEATVTQEQSSLTTKQQQLEELELENGRLEQKLVGLTSSSGDVDALRTKVSEMEEVERKYVELTAQVTEYVKVEQQCKVYQQDLEECKSYNKRYCDDIEIFKAELQAYSSLKIDHELLTERIRAMELERDSALEEIRIVQSELLGCRKQISSLQAELDRSQTMQEKQESAHSAALGKLGALQSEHDGLLEQHRTLQAREDALLKEVEGLTTAAAENQELVRVLEGDKAGLASQLQYLQAGSEEQQQQVVQAVEDEKRQLEEQLQLARRQVEDVEKLVEREKNLRDAAQNLAHETQNKMEDAVKQQLKLQDEIREAQTQVQEAVKLRKDTQNQLMTAQTQLCEAQQQLQAQVQAYSVEREQLVATVTQKHQESVAYHAEILRLGAQLTQVAENHTSERAQLASQLEEARQRFETVQLELAETTSAAADAPQQVEEELKRRRQAEESLRQVEEKLREASSTADKAVQEKQQLIMANKQFNVQYEDLAREVTALKESECRQQKEASRLKEHLLAVEEQQTKEQLQAQATEQQLRAANARLQEKIQATSVLLSTTSERTSSTVEQLQADVAQLQLERQQLNEQLQQLQEEHRSSSEAASTLQQVLAEFQRDQTRQLAEAVASERRRQEALTADNSALRLRTEQLMAEVSRVQQLQQEHVALQQHLRQRDQTLVSLQGQVSRQMEQLKVSKNEVALLKTGSDSKVDKTLVRNLVLGYLTSTAPQQRDALPVLATVLDMSPEERTRAGITRDGAIGGKGWMSSLADILAPPASNIRVTSKVDVIDSTSLSQAFVRFLEEESQPKPSARLPALQMAEETENRAKKGEARSNDDNALVRAATLSFPFSPALHPAMPAPPHHPPRLDGRSADDQQDVPPQQEPMTSSKLLSNLLNSDPRTDGADGTTRPT